MASNYPAGTDVLVNPVSTDLTNVVDHAANHSNANNAIEATQSAVGTHSGTNVLKNFVAGNFPARINSSGVLQQNISGTINNSIFGTPAITGGTAISQILTNPTINTGTANTSAFNGGTTGTLVNTGGLTLKDNGAITQSGTADHITITPGASKLVKTAVLEQDSLSNIYRNSAIMLNGWTFVTGDGTNTGFNKTITFGVTFTSAPIVMTSLLGKVDGSDPGTITAFVTPPGGNTAVAEISTGTCNIYLSLTTTSTNGRRYGIAWTAIGAL